MSLTRTIGLNIGLPAIAVFALAFTAAANNVNQPVTNSPSATGSGIVDDNASGWIWHGMVEYDDPGMHGRSGHAGGPGSYGAYTFRGSSIEIFGVTGPALTIDGRQHKMGRIKISIDGKPIGSTDMASGATNYDVSAYRVTGLSSSLHVLQVEPEDGWALVDYIVVKNSDDQLTAGESGDSSGQSIKSLIPAGLYYIASRKDNRLFLALHDYESTNGTAAEIFHLSQDHMETWKLHPLGDNRYELTPANAPQMCLALLTQTVTTDGKGYKIGTWQIGDYPAGQWYITPTDQGYYRISSVVDPNRVIDVTGGYMVDGQIVNGYDWFKSPNQQWTLIRAKK